MWIWGLGYGYASLETTIFLVEKPRQNTQFSVTQDMYSLASAYNQRGA